jgi:hypothetical protein
MTDAAGIMVTSMCSAVFDGLVASATALNGSGWFTVVDTEDDSSTAGLDRPSATRHHHKR